MLGNKKSERRFSEAIDMVQAVGFCLFPGAFTEVCSLFMSRRCALLLLPTAELTAAGRALPLWGGEDHEGVPLF